MRGGLVKFGVEWYVQLYMWLGHQSEEEGKVPFPYYTSNRGPFEECHPPQVLRGYIPQEELCIIMEVDPSLGSWLTTIQNLSWFMVSTHAGGHEIYH